MQSRRFRRTLRESRQRHTVTHFSCIFHIRHDKFQFPGIVQNNLAVSHRLVPVDTGHDQRVIRRCSEHRHLHTDIFPHQIVAHIQIAFQIPLFRLFFCRIAGSLGKQVVSVKYPALVLAEFCHGFFRPFAFKPVTHQINTRVHFIFQRLHHKLAEVHITLQRFRMKRGMLASSHADAHRTAAPVHLQFCIRYRILIKDKQSYIPAPDLRFLV